MVEIKVVVDYVSIIPDFQGMSTEKIMNENGGFWITRHRDFIVLAGIPKPPRYRICKIGITGYSSVDNGYLTTELC
jgi:hypothetical protein